MKFVDFFCGMGTIRMGFEQAGHECVYSVEFDKHKREIYKVIFGSEPDAGDIRTVRASDIPRSDCWCFGAPCQDFSIAGLRAGLDGERSSLVREVFRLVREKEPADRPEWLLYENVKGMLSSNSGWDFAAIQAEMGQLGYDVQWQLLNSKDFGVPQNRERVYTIGHFRRYGSRKIFPIGGNNPTTITVKGTLRGCGAPWDTRHEDICRVYGVDGLAPTVTSGQGGGIQPKILEVKQIGNVMPTATRDNPNQGRVYDTTGLAPCLNKMEGGGREPLITEPCACLTPDRLKKRQNGRRFKEPGEPMFTLTKQDIHGIAQNARIRRLTPRECMRLQGVPDYITDKLIAAGISDTQMYRAAGDACTVNVIYEIARRL